MKGLQCGVRARTANTLTLKWPSQEHTDSLTHTRTHTHTHTYIHTHTLPPTLVRNSVCAKDSFGHCPVYIFSPLLALPSLRNLPFEATH